MTQPVAEEYFRGRSGWVDWLVDRICPDRLAERIGIPGSRAELALATLQVGLGHLLGVADEDLQLPGALPADAVSTLISSWWRAGRADPLTSSYLDMTWIGLFQLARDTGKARPEFLTLLIQSQTGRQLARMTTQNLDPQPADQTPLLDLLAQVGEVRRIDPRSYPDLTFAWECEHSHLDIVRTLHRQHGLRALAGVISYLELAACMPETEDGVWDLAALDASSRLSEIYLSMPGSWPDPSREVPLWVRDVVTVQGARRWWTSTGFVPGWLIVAESDEELRAVVGWTYNPGFGIEHLAGDQLVLSLPLEFESGEKTHAGYRYRFRDFRQVSWLRAMIAMKWLRLDVYRLDFANRLRFEFSFGTQLPPELVDRLRELVREEVPSDEQLTIFDESPPREWLQLMSHTERNFFDGLAQCVDELDADSELGIAYRQYLRVTAAATTASLRGAPVDELHYAEAVEQLRVAISRHPLRELTPLELRHLGPGRALIQLVVTVDTPLSLQAFVAYLRSDGEPVIERLEFSSEIDLLLDHRTLDELCAHLRDGLARLTSLQEDGITSLVVSVGSGIYNFPFHDALLQLGFHEVSYTHRVDSLADRPAPDKSGTLVCGFPGTGADRIATVDVELQVVAALTGGTIGPLPRTLSGPTHLAGHAQTGSQPYEVGMWVGPGDDGIVSAAQVLLDIDASAASWVILSACATGAGEFAAGELTAAIPLDVAFIEKGARVVVSTAAPVNDQLACFFACVLQYEHANGSSIWESYLAARHATATAALSVRQAPLRALLSRQWPTWQSDISRRIDARDETWRFFRVSGRHW